MGSWLGDQVKRLRVAKGLSIRELALLAGIPHMTYVAYEQGKAAPPKNRRPDLARALGISVQELDEMVDDDEYEVFLRSRPLSDAGKASIRDFIRLLRERERAPQEGE